jgi:hypothetical protein
MENTSTGRNSAIARLIAHPRSGHHNALERRGAVCYYLLG